MRTRIHHLIAISITMTIITTTTKSTPSNPTLFTDDNNLSPPTTMNNSLTETARDLCNLGFTFGAEEIQWNRHLLMSLNNATIFVPDDAGVKEKVPMFYFNIRLHVPNQRLTEMDLINLRKGTELPTMEDGSELIVTEPGDGGLSSPMRINKVQITSLCLASTKRLVVHGIAAPFLKL